MVQVDITSTRYALDPYLDKPNLTLEKLGIFVGKYPPPKQVVILAGGRGTRLMEETQTIPKPMLTVGENTLLEHIIDIYTVQGLREFLIPVGYKKEIIFDYFRQKFELVYIDNSECLTGKINKIVVSIINTGVDTQTGGRIKRLQPRINAPFYITYGDGLGNVNLHNLRLVHEANDADVTLTAVHPIARFGALKLDGNLVTEFGEKTDFLSGWINGGFMLMNPSIFEMIDGDDTNLETDVLPYIASYGGLAAYKHEGLWKCVDIERDLVQLRELYDETGAEWLRIFG